MVNVNLGDGGFCIELVDNGLVYRTVVDSLHLFGTGFIFGAACSVAVDAATSEHFFGVVYAGKVTVGVVVGRCGETLGEFCPILTTIYTIGALVRSVILLQTIVDVANIFCLVDRGVGNKAVGDVFIILGEVAFSCCLNLTL